MMPETGPRRVQDRSALAGWLSELPGRVLLDAEVARLDAVLPNLFGYYLLQVGSLGNADLLSRSRILHRVIVETEGERPSARYSSISAEAEALPVASDSVDVVVLPHVLEYVPSAPDALREAARVLVPEGHLLALGFNPWSLLGLWRSILRRRGAAPWQGQFIGLRRMNDWLAALGFDVVSVDLYFFRPPFGRAGLMRRLRFMETLGRSLWPVLGGAYLIMAKKRVVTLTPVKPGWKPRRRLVAVGVAEPSARVRSAG